MRQLSFIFVFLLCLAFGLFSIRNSAPVAIELFPGLEIEAPLSVQLLFSLGFGAILSWLIGLWGGVQNLFNRFKNARELKKRDQQIEALEAELSRLRFELEQKKQLPAGAEPATVKELPLAPVDEIHDAEFETESSPPSQESEVSSSP
ncbi:MAG: lipopolysaccharide assembly protein LapA domain-containing protein [Cyanobacteria bacterium]|nr:lipopolysaccharide assembly protein LapA domain-containing protein [Cyanobacteriota bacterium]